MSNRSVSQGIQDTNFVERCWLLERGLLYSLVKSFLIFFSSVFRNSFKMRTIDSNLLWFWCLIIFVFKGWHKGQPYTKDTKVKNFIQWTKTQNEADQMKKTVIGGYYPFPRPPNNFLKYCKNNKGIIPANIFKTCSHFQFRLKLLVITQICNAT